MITWQIGGLKKKTEFPVPTRTQKYLPTQYMLQCVTMVQHI